MSSIHDTINDSHNKFDLNQFALTARKRKKNIFPITTINKPVFFFNHINLGIFKKSVFQLEILFTSLSNYVCQILNICLLIRAISNANIFKNVHIIEKIKKKFLLFFTATFRSCLRQLRNILASQ